MTTTRRTETHKTEQIPRVVGYNFIVSVTLFFVKLANDLPACRIAIHFPSMTGDENWPYTS